ncbi:MAG TPA: efflux RND transporter periplasmic adaptor subunit [Treponemataceae bacterium]|nr:efflux RND transporter periplasmic adaptor subunit [Treponemataceae bacterium]
MRSTQIKKNLALTMAVIFAGSLFISCGEKKEAEAQKVESETRETGTIFAVAVIPATRGELKNYLEFGGDVTAKTCLDIMPDAAGKIVDMKVRVGDTVKKDEIIAVVDASRPGMSYEPGPVKSPISGTITAVNVVVGSMVAQQLSIAKVGKMDTLEIIMNVPERYVSKIKNKQKAYLKFDAYPGETFPAEIAEVSPVLDPTSRTMSVKLSMIDQDPRIKAGMFARVKLITDTLTNIVKIPDTAVINRFGETFVFVVVPAKTDEETATVRKQMVKRGIRVDDKTEILSGLNSGDEVVIQGQSLLEDGSLINIVSRIQALPVEEAIR